MWVRGRDKNIRNLARQILYYALSAIILNCSFFQNLTLAMKTVCEILTTDLEGGPARIPFSLFKELYTYLAEIDGEIAKEHVDTVIEHLNYDA